MITALLICIVAIAAAAVCSAMMDKLWFHFDRSIWADKPGYFYDPKKSWKNKYKDGDQAKGPRFPGATTWLVSLTDAWHLAKKGLNAAMALLPAFWLKDAGSLLWWHTVLLWIGAQVFFGLVFSLFFDRIFAQKKD